MRASRAALRAVWLAAERVWSAARKLPELPPPVLGAGATLMKFAGTSSASVNVPLATSRQ